MATSKNQQDFQMKEDHKELIRKNYCVLQKALSSDTQVLNLANFLMQEEIISDEMRTEIRKATNPAVALLDMIPRRGPNAFDAFYQAALEYEVFEVADILKPAKAPHFEKAVGQPTMNDGVSSPEGQDNRREMCLQAAESRKETKP